MESICICISINIALPSFVQSLTNRIQKSVHTVININELFHQNDLSMSTAPLVRAATKTMTDLKNHNTPSFTPNIQYSYCLSLITIHLLHLLIHSTADSRKQ